MTTAIGNTVENLDSSTDDNKTIYIDSKMKMEEIYLTTYKKVNDILSQFHQEFPPKDKFVDIKGFVKWFDIDIIEKSLDSKYDVFYQEVSGYVDYYDYKRHEFKWTIYVNNNLGDLTKRYIIAHELSHFLLKKNRFKEKSFTKYCVNPLIPMDSEEQLCDIISSFILMPIDTVLDLMKDYMVSHKGQKINVFEWLDYLGCQMGISDYHTVICYQNVRYLGGFLYSYLIQEDTTQDKAATYCKQDFESIYDKIKNCPELFR